MDERRQENGRQVVEPAALERVANRPLEYSDDSRGPARGQRSNAGANDQALTLAERAFGGKLLDYAQVAELLNVSVRSVRRWVAEGELVPMFTRGSVVRFDLPTVQRFIRANAGGARGGRR